MRKGPFFKTAFAFQHLAASTHVLAEEDRDAFIKSGDDQSRIWANLMSDCSREHAAKARSYIGLKDKDQLYA